jgi:hypothetical protein
MNRDEIAETSYDAAIALTNAQLESGHITEEGARIRNERTETARSIMHTIDEALTLDKEECDRRLWAIKEEGVRMMDSTITDKNDLDWKTGSIWANAPRVAVGLLKSMGRRSR